LNPEIVRFTVKVRAETAVPPGVDTVTAPVVALSGITAVIWVVELTVRFVAIPLPKLTLQLDVKLVPVMMTESPAFPFAVLSAEIVGSG
jgi:hypothetical protein